jgi:hypothetical protein
VGRKKLIITYHQLNIYNFENEDIELIDEKMLYNFHNYFHQNEFLERKDILSIIVYFIFERIFTGTYVTTYTT